MPARRGLERERPPGITASSPPIELGDLAVEAEDAPGLEMRADAERGVERHAASRELEDRRVIEVIVVIVRDEHGVEGRQGCHVHRRTAERVAASST